MIEIGETAKIGESLTSLILIETGEIEMILMIGIGEILEMTHREMNIVMRGTKEGQKGLSEKMIGLALLKNRNLKILDVCFLTFCKIKLAVIFKRTNNKISVEACYFYQF